jgi:hypothetical protein
MMIAQETEFDSVYVIESLRSNERHTGRNVYDCVLVPFQRTSPWFEVDYFDAPDLPSFQQALLTVLGRARAGRVPILHIEAHGSRGGVHLAHGNTPVRWEDMRETLTAINEATHFRLLVVMAMCKGAYLASVLHPPHPAPAWAVIGPEVDVDDVPMENGMWLQYDALLSSQDGDAALAALNAEQSDPAQRYYMRSAEQMFHDVVWQFFQKQTPETRREHENRIVAESTRKWGYDMRAAAKAREVANRRLPDEQYWYDFWRPDFLMLDRFPENASRFSLTYEDYKASRASSVP